MEVDPNMEVNTIIEYAAFFFLEISKTGTCPARGLKEVLPIAEGHAWKDQGPETVPFWPFCGGLPSDKLT